MSLETEKSPGDQGCVCKGKWKGAGRRAKQGQTLCDENFVLYSTGERKHWNVLNKGVTGNFWFSTFCVKGLQETKVEIWTSWEAMS